VQRPLISIITPSFHAAGTIGETLDSVLPQLSDDVEHLLIDACSTDGTLEIAGKYPHLSIRSERDKGIYDGMNKGAALAAGEWLLFLQADDWLPAGTLDAYRKAFKESPMAEVICGSAEALKESSGRWSAVWSVTDRDQKKLTFENIALGEPMINARLFRKSSFEKLGGFSLEYSLASDRDFLLRAAEAAVIQHEVDAMTYRYRWHAGSSTMTEGNALSKKLRQENLKIAEDHLRRVHPADRGILKTWRARLSIEEGMNALETGEGKVFFNALVSGCREQPLWPFYLAMEFVKSLPGFVMRGGKTRTQVRNLKKSPNAKQYAP
jgi:glycosyltransferase involved in cell wall biosynthesis